MVEIDRTKDDGRDVRGTAQLERLWQDIRYAVRALRRQPTFTLAVVLILGCGIGANSAVFTIVNGLLLAKLPVPHPEQLVIVGTATAVHSSWTGSPQTDYVSYPLYADIRDHNTVLSNVYANGYGDDWDISIDGGNSFETARTRCVTGGFFSTLQVPAYLGRTFTAAEDATPSQDPVAVISYAYWQRRFGGDKGVVGRVIHINHTALTIVGVTPASFTGDIVGESTDLWLPMMMMPAIRPNRRLIDNRQASWLVMVGRLEPGVTLAQARAQLTAVELASIHDHLSGQQLKEFDEDLVSDPIRVESGATGFSSVRSNYQLALLIAMAAVALVALIVCANVCSLMLTRATARAREMTVRMALGAGRGRLVQQVLTECALLAVLAGCVGLVVAVAGSRLLLAVAATGENPIVVPTGVNAAIVAFTAAVTVACLALFGLAPALRAARVDIATALRAQGRNLMGSRSRAGRFPLVRTLVLAQIALSMLLLMGSGLLVRSVQQLLNIDLGMDRDHLLMVHVAATRIDYAGERLAHLRRELAARAARVPGVSDASYSVEGLFSGGESTGRVDVPGFVAQADSEHQVDYDEVGPGFFHAIGARIVRGRDFTASDVDGRTHAAAIDETMANAYFRGHDPIGRSITLDSVAYTVTAVVRDVQERDLRAAPQRRMYFTTLTPSPLPQSFELEIHVRGDPARLVEPLRQALASVDPTVPVSVEPFSARIRAALAEDVLIARVTIVVGLLALGLAALGLYGVTAYSTQQRTSEFGLRSALGAAPHEVAAMVLGEAARLAVAGVVIGLPLGIAATRLIRRQIFGVGVVDAPSLAIATAVLVIVSLAASYIPARRAAGVSAMEALRAE